MDAPKEDAILFIGDVMGRPGRRLLRDILPGIRRRLGITAVVANGENSAGGLGITKKSAEEIFGAGVDVITSGNHIWDKREALDYLAEEPGVLRPTNYPPGAPGRGFGLFETDTGREFLLINVHGRVFIDTSFDCPFRAMEEVLGLFPGAATTPVLVDFHAEATSEKMAMGYAFDGRVAAILGTHTHVQTNDARILPAGTAYVTDVGMTGPADGVIGVDSDAIVRRFYTQLPTRFRVASGPKMLNAALLRLHPHLARVSSIQLINERYE
ncbi:MAG: TIGR00282 family metallophosphoesterase [Clostridia bacterium]